MSNSCLITNSELFFGLLLKTLELFKLQFIAVLIRNTFLVLWLCRAFRCKILPSWLVTEAVGKLMWCRRWKIAGWVGVHSVNQDMEKRLNVPDCKHWRFLWSELHALLNFANLFWVEFCHLINLPSVLVWTTNCKDRVDQLKEILFINDKRLRDSMLWLDLLHEAARFNYVHQGFFAWWVTSH